MAANNSNHHMGEKTHTRYVFIDLKEIFSAADVDQDGYLSEEEIRLTFSRINLPASYARRVFEAADLDDDEKISFEEWRTFVEPKLQRLQEAFSHFDKNGDGNIDSHEMYHVLEELELEVTEKDAELLRQEIDHNGDGKVDFADFLGVFALLEPIDLLHHFDDVSSMFELGSTTDFVAARLKLTQHKSQPLLEVSEPYRIFARLAAGGVAAVIAQFCCQPIETIKVRLQNEANLGNIAKKYKSFSNGAMMVVAEEGLARGLWKGMLPSAMRELSYSSLRFGLYKPIKKVLGANNPRDTPFWLVSSFLTV